MTNSDNDPVLRRAIDDLRRLPPLDSEAVRRVVSAAAVARVSPAEDDDMIVARPRRSLTVWTVAGIAAAAAIVGFTLHGVWTSHSPAPVNVVSSAPAATKLQTVDMGRENDALPVPQQFVFENARAHRVSIVGDFNGWGASKTPMVHTPDGTSWSVIVPVMPGRHIYGFMVDDSVFTLDPRAPKSRDVDLGTEGSVVIVGRP